MRTGRVIAVNLLDRVVLPGDRVESWLERWTADYLPGARERGMVPVRVWRSHTGPDETAVHILWEIPAGVRGFFGMRGRGGNDPAVAAFWAYTDAVAVTRERTVLEPVEVER